MRFRERAEPPATSIEYQRVCHFLSYFFRRAGEMPRTLRTCLSNAEKDADTRHHNVAILETIGDISSLGIVAGMVFSFRLAAALSSPPDEAFLRCH